MEMNKMYLSNEKKMGKNNEIKLSNFVYIF